MLKNLEIISLDENSATPESAEPVVEIENDLNILRRDSSCGVVYDKGDTLIQLGDEQEFRGVPLRNGAQLLDTAGDCKDLDFRTNVKTDDSVVKYVWKQG